MSDTDLNLGDYSVFTAFGPIGYGMVNQMQQAELQKKQAAFAQQQKTRQAIAQSRMAAARAANTAANQGASTSSGAAGGASSISAQLSTNLGSIFSTGAYQHKLGNMQMWGNINEGINVLGSKAASTVMAFV